ncbi:MAG: LptF/LptG family permease [Candidatus Margulisbacteria bacterium]|nr:LptF/LptG family permease [Candidatus Margulisiibacteriota bacterium]
MSALAIYRGFLGRFKIIDRYIINEIAGPFVLGMAGLVIIGMMDIVFSLVDMFFNNGVPFPIVFKILIFKIPAIMVLFFPMAILFSTTIVLIRMIKDSELTVFRAGGVSLLRVILPVFAAGLIASLLSFGNNEKLVPWANSVSEDLIDKAVLKKPVADILENTFFKESDARYFYIRKIDKQNNTMEDVVINETTGSFPRAITAKKAFWDGDRWLLEKGIIHKFDENGALSYQGDFENMQIHIDKGFYNYYKSQKSPMEMSSKELSEKIDNFKKSGQKTDSLEVAYYMKYSLPLACLIFALVGTALLLFFMGSGRDLWGVIVAVLLALLSVGFYIFLMATFRAMGNGGRLAPFWGAWAPNFIYGLLALGIIAARNKAR